MSNTGLYLVMDEPPERSPLRYSPLGGHLLGPTGGEGGGGIIIYSPGCPHHHCLVIQVWWFGRLTRLLYTQVEIHLIHA